MISIRKITKTDCLMNKERIAELLYLNDKAHNYTDSCTLEESLSEATDMCSYIEAGKADVFCVFDEEQIEGLIWGFPFKFRDEQRFHIRAMIVDPRYRKKGLSQLLLLEIEKAARARQIFVIDTYVDWSNVKARKAYEKYGLVNDRVMVRKKLS